MPILFPCVAISLKLFPTPLGKALTKFSALEVPPILIVTLFATSEILKPVNKPLA